MSISKDGRVISLSEAFFYYGAKDKKDVSTMWKLTDGILSHFFNRISYSVGGFHYGTPYFVDMMKGISSANIFSVDIANKLKDLSSNNTKPIVCTDFISPYQFPIEVKFDSSTNCWLLNLDEELEKLSLYEDERYLVVIYDADYEIQIYLFKK